ncbi:hypothetical protein [Streptomyces sp. NPDC018610]|uniref:hypothetical protein n=1 Tax=Streptomyces sp. NPDC018610 TaxID=3365049 RepID=UPI003798126C
MSDPDWQPERRRRLQDVAIETAAGTRRHPDFRVAVAGTDVHPQFDRAVIVAWLLAHDKSEVPVAMPSASLLVTGGAGPRRSGSTARI